MKDSFNCQHIDASKELFDFPYNMNLWTLVQEPRKLKPGPKKLNINREYANQLWFAAPIYRILYVAQCRTTLSKNTKKTQIVCNIQYMLLFLIETNTLNPTRFMTDPCSHLPLTMKIGPNKI